MDRLHLKGASQLISVLDGREEVIGALTWLPQRKVEYHLHKRSLPSNRKGGGAMFGLIVVLIIGLAVVVGIIVSEVRKSNPRRDTTTARPGAGTVATMNVLCPYRGCGNRRAHAARAFQFSVSEPEAWQVFCDRCGNASGSLSREEVVGLAQGVPI